MTGLFAVQGTLKSLLQHHSLKALILWCSAFFMVQLSHLYTPAGKTIALTTWTFVGKVISLLSNMLSRFVMGEGNSNLLQYSCLGNSMDRGAWWATVHGVTKSQTWLRQLSTVQGYKCRYLSFAQQLRVKRMFSGELIWTQCVRARFRAELWHPLRAWVEMLWSAGSTAPGMCEKA